MLNYSKRSTLLLLLTMVSMVAALYATFLYAPTEREMGHIQRIFYFHMGSVWVATIAFTLVFIASIQYLRKGSRFWDILALASAETGVLFLTITLVTGSIWAKPIWGTWWTWDPQITTTFVLWILYIAYLFLRSAAGDSPKAARVAAIFAIFAFLDLPLVYISVRVLRGISPVVFGGRGGGIDPDMMVALVLAFVACTLFFLALLRERMALEKASDRLQELQQL